MPKCFVIMPYEKKRDRRGNLIDFDKVYDVLIKKAVEDEGIVCDRADKKTMAGPIHRAMLEDIYEADVAVVDITTQNANVFYELGVRHALAGHVTVLIKQKGTKSPFNINGLRTIEYAPAFFTKKKVTKKLSTEAKKKLSLKINKELDEKRKEISATIRKGLEKLEIDSLVYTNVRTLQAPEPRKIITTNTRYQAKLAAAGKLIGIITGDIRDVRDIDVWVSSENTNMQMARFYEKSISGTIRYHAAKRKAGLVVEDTLANELALALDGRMYVDAADVIATDAGQLQISNAVRRIFHAAAVQGEVGVGFRPISDIGRCATHALELADGDEKHRGLSSMLFPLMGTGQGGGELLKITKSLVAAAKSYLERPAGSVIQSVYFLCWTERDLRAAQWGFREARLVLEDA